MRIFREKHIGRHHVYLIVRGDVMHAPIEPGDVGAPKIILQHYLDEAPYTADMRFDEVDDALEEFEMRGKCSVKISAP